MCLAQRLPPEILSQVFHILRDDTITEEFHAPSSLGFGMGWICVTWVCRLWRDTALERRTLWTKFATRRFILYPEAIAVFLNRAPDEAALHITITDARPWPRTERKKGHRSDGLEYLLAWAVADRIEYLSLSLRWEDDTDSSLLADTNEFLGTLGPSVRTLVLAGAYDYPFTFNLHGGLRNLRKLHLGCLPSGNVQLPNIPHITIEDCFEQGHDHMHRFLPACPNVEVLEIINSLASGFDDYHPENLPVVSFSRLRLFIMRRESLPSVKVALGTFRLPPAASFELEVINEGTGRTRHLLRPDGWLRHELFPDDLGNIPVLSSTHSLTLGVENEDDLQFRVHGRAGPNQSDEPHWSVQANCDGGTYAMTKHRYLVRFLHSLSLLVQPALIVRLELHLGDWLPVRQQELWQELFEDFPVLRVLSIGGWEAIEAATRTLEVSPALLPELEELGLCVSTHPSHTEMGEAMVRWLGVRQLRGYGPERLKVSLWRRLSTETRAFLDTLVANARRVKPSLEAGAVEGDACGMCGPRRAVRGRAGSAMVGRDSQAEQGVGPNKWEWDDLTYMSESEVASEEGDVEWLSSDEWSNMDVDEVHAH